MVDKYGAATLGPALARAWLGYHRRVQASLAAEGFADQGFPDGPILRLCQEPGVTVTELGRELGISRQGASKFVAGLVERGYVSLEPSPSDRREKIVRPTAHARARVAAAVTARRALDREIAAELGEESLAAVRALAGLLTDPAAPPLRDLWREQHPRRAALLDPGDG